MHLERRNRQGIGLHRAKNIGNGQMGMKINVGKHSETYYTSVELDSAKSIGNGQIGMETNWDNTMKRITEVSD